MRYVDALSEKGLICTGPTSVLMRSGIKKNSNLHYTLGPIREAVEFFHNHQMMTVERAAERQQIQRKLSAIKNSELYQHLHDAGAALFSYMPLIYSRKEVSP